MSVCACFYKHMKHYMENCDLKFLNRHVLRVKIRNKENGNNQDAVESANVDLGCSLF